VTQPMQAPPAIHFPPTRLIRLQPHSNAAGGTSYGYGINDLGQITGMSGNAEKKLAALEPVTRAAIQEIVPKPTLETRRVQKKIIAWFLPPLADGRR
jgi:hypothetical protein